MSETEGTLAHALMIGDKNIVDAGCSNVLNDCPLLAAIRTTYASHGTLHQYLRELTAPSVGFRPVNTGRTNTGGTEEEVQSTLKYLDPSWDCDVAIVDAYPLHKGGPAGFIQKKSARSIRQAMFGAEKQILYGSDSDGFTGLNLATTLRYKDSEMVLDATGSTANTGSSVWFIRTDDSESEAMFVLGNQGNITVPDEATIVQKVDEDGKIYYAYAVPMGGHFGFQIGSKYSVGRIVNLTADGGKGLTDALIYTMLSKFPAGHKPNLIGMGRRSQEQLRKSRTATNATGAPAPIPTEVENIPIIVTESIGATEAIVGATP